MTHAGLLALPERLTPATRREFLSRLTASLGILALGGCGGRRAQRWETNPFALGVAAGDPAPDGIVLWTRLIGEADAARLQEPIEIDWELASDERFSRIDRDGSATASPDLAHSVHVEVAGLEPDREYWYRFRSGGEVSTAGRFRTAPRSGAAIDPLRFAFASCQHYEQGHYTSLRHLAAEDIRFVIHLGDYIYEDGIHDDRPRQHDGNEVITLDAYRNRYALYKEDADLQAAHAAFAWIVTWDDHEVDNNYANDAAQDDQSPDALLLRRAAAYQAYYEHTPVRASARPRGPDARIYRRLRFGDLMDVSVVDTRQHRTDQPCGDGIKPRCEDAYSEDATMFGSEQEEWLFDGLAASASRWNVIANQVPVGEIDNVPGPEGTYSMDRWDGYVAARRRFLEFVRDHASDVVVLTGDVHANWVADLKPDFADGAAAPVATEFICTSLSSGGDGADESDFGRRGLAANPHMRFFNGQRGYVRCTVGRDLWTSDYRVVEYVSRPGAPITTRAAFVVERGRTGAQPA